MSRRPLVFGAEDAVECRLALKPAFEIDIRDREVAVRKQNGRVLQPDIIQVVIEILVEAS